MRRVLAAVIVAGLALVACRKRPAEKADPNPRVRERWEEEAAKHPHETALCYELNPCGATDRFPSCVLYGSAAAPAEHIPGLTIERLDCNYRSAGDSPIVGVPDDGSRPLLTEDALLARVHDHPSLRALVAGASDRYGCPVVEEDGLLHFCKGGGTPRQSLRCVMSANDAVGCAQEHPERFLRACQSRHPGKAVRGVERYWGPGLCALPSDHVKDGRQVGRVPEPEGTSASYESAKIALRAGGKEVRVLDCGPGFTGAGPSMPFVDGDAEATTDLALIPRLDTDAMRATIIASMLKDCAWAVLLDPIGGDTPWRADECKAAPGPRREGKRLVFYMTRSIEGELARCTADPHADGTWTGACVPVPHGTFCGG